MPAARPFRSAVASAAILATVSACSSSAGNSKAGPASTVTVTVTADKGCVPSSTELKAGGVTFKISNKDATAVSEVELLSGARIVGEKENLPPGFNGTFAVNVTAGRYTLYCPGATPERRAVTVSGKAQVRDTAAVALLSQATRGYAQYVREQVAALLVASRRLDTALHGADLAAAQAAYAQARPFYEKIEPVAESFSVGKDNIDADIDARAGDVPAAQWRGFHVIEKGLFAAESLKGLGPVGDRLVQDVRKLQSLVATLRYQPTELANGAQELLDEVAGSKITGEEERYSHIDLLDVEYNTEGALQAFAQLQPALQSFDAPLARTIAARFAALQKLIDGYRDPKDISGFVRYTTLTSADKRALAAAVKAVQEPLSRVATKVAGHR
jgi:iron uptake system component EfeO